MTHRRVRTLGELTQFDDDDIYINVLAHAKYDAGSRAAQVFMIVVTACTTWGDDIVYASLGVLESASLEEAADLIGRYSQRALEELGDCRQRVIMAAPPYDLPDDIRPSPWLIQGGA